MPLKEISVWVIVSQNKKNVRNYEERIKELENTVLELSAKLEKIETVNEE